MEIGRRNKIQQSLRTLAESYRATMGLMEQTLALLCEELALEPVTYNQARTETRSATVQERLLIDPDTLCVHYHGKFCFLGNTLAFRFLRRLAQRPNTYVSYEALLSEVWEGVRSDDAVRSVAKTLRCRLRRAGLADLAAAVDGTVPGHYSLKLPT